MDPMSMTASVIAVLQLVTALTCYLTDVRNATSEQQKVAVEASMLSSLLVSLRYRLEAAHTDDAWFRHARLLGTENGPLHQMKSTLEEVAGHIVSPSGVRTRDVVKSALIWKFTKSNLNALFQRMERLKSLIQMALSADHFALSQAIDAKVVDIASTLQQVRLDLRHLHDQNDGAAWEKLSNWLSVPDPYMNYHIALKKRHAKTGTWLLEDQLFIDWKAASCSSLWLHGKAGCGKTVLSATVLESILKDTASCPDTVVAYFYFDFNDVAKRSAIKAMQSLLMQFAQKVAGGGEALLQLFRRCSDGQQQPTEDQIQSLLVKLIKKTEQNYIILDALDECQDHDGLLTFLEQMLEPPQHKTRVLVTSRCEREIEIRLGQIVRQTISIQTASVQNDINAYVRHQLYSNRKLGKWPASIQEEIAEQLKMQADGMFRWVYCQLEALQSCVQLRDLRKALRTLPKSLDETYASIINKIESNGHRENAITVLRWLCFSDRPLQLAELVDILAITPGAGGGFDPQERMPDPDDILLICASLISRYSTWEAIGDHEGFQHDYYVGDLLENDGLPSPDATWIRLAHYSVQEYLLSERCVFRAEFVANYCHASIGESCLHYLKHIDRKPIRCMQVLDEYPLIVYAAHSWWHHMNKAGEKSSRPHLDLICDFFSDQDGLLAWRLLSDVDDEFSGKTLLQPERRNLASPLYYAALTGLPGAVKKFVKDGVDVNLRGGSCGSALRAAIQKGHIDVVQVLLEAGANVTDLGHSLRTCLEIAAEGGYVEIVHMLIDAGVDVNSRESAICLASWCGHLSVVQALIKAGADVNNLGSQRRSALYGASLTGEVDIVRALVSAGAEINVDTLGACGNALCAASAEYNREILQILLDHGANINQPNWFGSTALHYLCYSQSSEGVVFLLPYGPDPALVDGYGYSCFDLVASNQQVFDELKQLLPAYSPISTTTRSGYLRRSILQAIDRQWSLSEIEYATQRRLSRCLLFLADEPNALKAFALQAYRDHDGLVRHSHIGCDLCDQWVTGIRYVCTRCVDIDLCVNCIDRYMQGEHLTFCRGHQFFKVPAVAWDDSTDLNGRKLTNDIRTWLQELAYKISLSLQSDLNQTTEQDSSKLILA